MFIKRITALFLCILMVVTLVACDPANPTGETTKQEETQALPFNLTEQFVVVRPDEADEQTIASGQLLIRAITEIYGFSPVFKTDWAKTPDDIKPYEYEILIGKTNREISKQFDETTTILDYTYSFISEKQIVIYGKSGESVYAAVEKFLLDCFNYNDETKTGTKKQLYVGDSFVFKYDYKFDALKFNNIDANNYSIVAKNTAKSQAVVLADSVEKLCGVRIPIVDFADFTGGNAIYVGIGDEGGSIYSYGQYEYLITAKNTGGNSSIIIDAPVKQLGAAISEFTSEYLPKGGSGSFNVSVVVDKDVFGYTCEDELNGVEFVSEAKETLSSGVIYSKKTYKDENGKPVIAYVLTIEPGSAKLITGTPSDGTVLTGAYSTVLNEMKAAVANDKNVIVGINADFYDLAGKTYKPNGLCVKDGHLMQQPGSRPWFAMLDDGSFVVESGNNYSIYSDRIYTGVGGRQILLLDGAVNDIAYKTEFGYTRHPRTAIGIRGDGGIVMIVVDGRQPSISNGASLADLAVMLKDLGCVSALNLDGGGSSSFVTRSGTTYRTRNSPSDGNLRGIYNSLLVVPIG